MLAATSGLTILSYLGYVSLVVTAIFIVLGARANQARRDLNDSVTALQGRLLADQDEIRNLQGEVATQKALVESANVQVADLRSAVRTLERTVSGVDLIKAGFEHLGVPAEVLRRAGNGNGLR